jgi:hypothetical protein
MKNFIFGLIVGVAFAVCGYKPYMDSKLILAGSTQIR